MDADRWRQISLLFHAARARTDEDRAAFLAAECGGDHGLRDEVEWLLARDASGEGFNAPAAEVFADLPKPGSATVPGGVRPGMTVGSYRIERLLGRGGMGTVFLAYDTTLRRQVALKMMDAATDGEMSRMQLLREARNAAALNHPSICTIHEVGEANGSAFIAMEYVEGRSLRDRLDEGVLPPGEAVRYGIQAADALAYAHDHGVVHRDFKAANAIVTEGGRLKIVDFGLARRSDAATASATTMASVVPAGTAAGTPYAMAPEQVRGDPSDGRTDIWALGVLLYEALTAATPFGTRRPIPELFSAILRDPPAPLPAAVPRALCDVVERCLEKDPAQRYQTAAEVRAALDALTSSSTGAVYSARTRRGRLIGAGGAAALAVVVALFGLNRVSLPRTAQVPDTIESLAILPLEDLTQDPAQAYFSDGMTEELITKVARIQQLRVVPRSAVMKYRAARRPPVEVARELGVDAILEGSVFRSGNRVRISIHLIDPGANRELWAESYERDLGDVLALQTEVSLAIATKLRVSLTPLDRARLATGDRAVNPAAYDDYLRGLTHIENVNRADSEAAIIALERATALAPDFADALGALALAYAQLYGSFAPGEASLLEPKAKAAIARAFALSPESAGAFHARGTLIWNAAHGWPHEESAGAYRAAIALKPNFDSARRSLAVVYNHLGLTDAALRVLAQSSDLPAVLFQKGLAFRIQDKLDQALTFWLAIPPSSRNTTHVGHIAWVLSDLGRTAEAWSVLGQARSTGNPDVNGMLSAAEALLHAVGGEGRQAQEANVAATARAADTRESHHATYVVASAYARLGNPSESVRWLRFTAANGFPCYPLMAEDPNLDSLRSYAPFVELLEELKIRWEGYRVRLGS